MTKKSKQTESGRATWSGILILCLVWATKGLADPPALETPRDLGGGWIEAEGRAAGANITPDVARQKALEDARRRAIEFALGLDVQSFSSLLQEEDEGGFRDAAFLQLSTQTSAGRIVDQKTPEYGFLPADTGQLYPVYRVRVQVKVTREEGQADPGFQIDAGLNQEVFRVGDEMRLAITATQPCYVTVLNWTAVDTVVVLLPNKYRQARRVEPGDTLWVPDTGEEAMGVHYRVFLPTGRQEAAEALWVIATKKDYAFGQGWPEVESALKGYRLMPTRQGAWTELMRWLVQIPRDERTEAQAVYEVRERK